MYITFLHYAAIGTFLPEVRYRSLHPTFSRWQAAVLEGTVLDVCVLITVSEQLLQNVSERMHHVEVVFGRYSIQPNSGLFNGVLDDVLVREVIVVDEIYLVFNYNHRKKVAALHAPDNFDGVFEALEIICSKHHNDGIEF